MTFIAVLALGIVGFILLCSLWAIGSYNGLVRMKTLVEEAWSGIDVQLKRRYDLIPNLVTVVKQYSIHEQTVLENITKYRSIAAGATTMVEKGRAESELSGALKTLFAVAENYPQLKANENFLSLQQTLSSLEDEIQLSRRYYNGATRDYMSTKKSFPTNIIASLGGFADVSYFELTSAEQRETPTIKF